MKLAQLVPVENRVVNGYALVDDVFGSGIVVHDVLGDMHTTATNARLLARSRTILENIGSYDIQGLAAALTELREQAEIIEQADYDRAVRRERSLEPATDDDAAWVGALA